MANVSAVVPAQSRKPSASVSGQVDAFDTLTLRDNGACCAISYAGRRYPEVSS